MEYLQIYWTDFGIFLPYESTLRADDGSVPYFPICHGNQIILQKRYQRRLIPLAFIALMLENELQYHGLAVRIKAQTMPLYHVKIS